MLASLFPPSENFIFIFMTNIPYKTKKGLATNILQMDCKAVNFIFLILLLQGLYYTHGLVGYDCGSASSNITTVSLLTIEECDIPPTKVNSTRLKLQLLQANDFHYVIVRQCKVEIDRVVKKCGMFSHTMDVMNGKYAYIQETTHQACLRMHMYGTFHLGKVFMTGLKVNQSMSRPITLAGNIENDGACAGSAFTDEYGSWTNVVVLATVKITLQQYRATVKLNTNQVILRSGVYCELKSGQCADIEGGDTYWDSIPDDSCKETSFGVLFDGYAIKIIDSADPSSQTVYSIATQDTTFALASRGEVKTCGYPLIKTEHPKLFIFETYTDLSIFKKIHNPANTDIFTYMNSKFVYVEKHFRTQLDQLYRNILYQQCYLEQKMLQNALAIATQSPDIFAYHLMKAPGYTSVLAGEVIHIIKCVPVEVQVARTTNCYQQLPVLKENKTYYLAPQTHLLLRQGTQVNCNLLAPIMYQLGETWYKMLPQPTEGIPPTILKPMTKPIWKYINPGSLATSGIYSQMDLEEFKDHILFPAERPSVLNTIARGMMGHATTIHGGSIANLLDETSLEKLASSAWEKIWGRFLTFGNISAGLFGVFVLIRIVKLILDTILHGVALHSIFGCSCYLIGALWDSLTQLLILIGGKKSTKTNNDNMELHEIISTKNQKDDYPSTAITLEPSYPINTSKYQQLRTAFPSEENTSCSLNLTMSPKTSM